MSFPARRVVMVTVREPFCSTAAHRDRPKKKKKKCGVVSRVWDKVISGSCKILVFVALEILLSYKIMLLGMSRPEGIVKFLCNVSPQLCRNETFFSFLASPRFPSLQIPQENTDAIVTKAIDLWHKYCGTPIHAM